MRKAALLIRCFFFTCLFLQSALALANSIDGKIDSTDVSEGESFQVTYTVHGQYSGETPDLSKLENDFTILGTNHSVQMTIVNSRSSSITTWEFMLIPKRSGKLVIPAIRFGRSFSLPIEVQVKPARDLQQTSRSRPNFIQMELDNKSPYVQSQVILKVKLYYVTNLAQGNLTEPEIQDAVVLRLGNDRQYQDSFRNKRYNVLERNYAIFPQKSGKMRIKPIIFTGVAQSVRNGFAFGGRPIRIVSKSVTLQVRSIPAAAFNHAWLPARSLVLREAWSVPNGDIHVGDPITRTVITHAEGLTSGQLPDVVQTSVPGFNVYPDKSISNDSVTSDIISAQRKEHVAYVPSEPGDLIIPAIELYWWDTTKNELDKAVLPARHLTVLPGIKATNKIATPKAVQDIELPTPPKANDMNNGSLMPYYLAGGFALLWLLTLGAWWLYSKRKHPATRAAKQVIVVESRSKRSRLQALKIACEQNRAEAAKTALLKWAELYWRHEEVRNLGQLAEKIDDKALKDEIHYLNKLLYSDPSLAWDGNGLWRCVRAFNPAAQANKHRRQDDLPPMYPE